MTNNDRKDIILTAAVRELNLRGYARTTMTQVEMAAADALKPRGCAPEPDGFIYEDFNSKEAIAAEWFARVIKKATERAKEDVIDLGDAQRLRVALEYVMRELLHRLQSRRVFVAGALAFGTPLAPIDPQLYELPREAFIKEMELLFEKLNLLKHVEVRLKELELQPSDFFGVLFFAYGLLVLAWLADRSANFEHTTEAMKHLAGIIAAALYSPGGRGHEGASIQPSRARAGPLRTPAKLDHHCRYAGVHVPQARRRSL